MLIDHRTYTLHPHKLRAWLELYERYGLPVQKKHLGPLVGYFVSDIGPLNQVIHLWSYDSIEDRARRRAALAADPGWVDFLKRVGELAPFQAQENKILVPTSFSPLQ